MQEIFMRRMVILIGTLMIGKLHAVVYDGYEINATLNSTELQQLSEQYSQQYFTAQQPEKAVNKLLTADLTPLQREYILFNLLTQISQQPPQDYHQALVDQMKTYAIQATQVHEEGYEAVAIFNLRAKAHGIENIWLAYRTEQQFNQWFKHDLKQAMTVAQQVIANNSRPQWLGIKNSIAALTEQQRQKLVQHLLTEIKEHAGLDPLISHVGLLTADLALLDKALQSTETAVRQLTLRQLQYHLPAAQAKNLLMAAATDEKGAAFGTALLGQFVQDPDVQAYLLTQLQNQKTAETAAYALSRSEDEAVIRALQQRYLNSDQQQEKRQILFALKMNPSSQAQLALDDLTQHIDSNSQAGQWLKSFQGEQP